MIHKSDLYQTENKPTLSMESRETVARCCLSAETSLAVIALVWASIRAVLQGAQVTSFKCHSPVLYLQNLNIRTVWGGVFSPTRLSPAAIPDIPGLYSSIEGGGSKTSIFKKDTAWDAITAAHQRFYFLFTATKVDIFVRYTMSDIYS